MAYNFGNIWNAFHGFWVGLEIMSTTNGYPRGPKNFRNTFLHKIDPLNQIIMTHYLYFDPRQSQAKHNFRIWAIWHKIDHN